MAVLITEDPSLRTVDDPVRISTYCRQCRFRYLIIAFKDNLVRKTRYNRQSERQQ